MVNKSKFKIVKTGISYLLYYNKIEIGRYRTKKAANTEMQFLTERYQM